MCVCVCVLHVMISFPVYVQGHIHHICIDHRLLEVLLLILALLRAALYVAPICLSANAAVITR